MSLNTSWTKGLTDKDIKSLKEHISLSRFPLERLIKILEDKKEKTIREMKQAHITGNEWPYQQAIYVSELKNTDLIIGLIKNYLTSNNK